MKLTHISKRARAVIKAQPAWMIFFHPSKKPTREPIQAPMFDDQTVTDEDIRAWLRAVPRLDPDSPRAAQYVRAYNVPDKIRAEKSRGTFQRTITTAHAFKD